MFFLKLLNKKICILTCFLIFSCCTGYVSTKASDTNLYELYPTQNIYTFLKLNTKTGQITQLQYSINSDDRFEVIINDFSLNVDGSPSEEGRFKLYPTQNIYNFLLLDTLTGKVWQVQWSTKESNRGIIGEIK